mgnify:CR=1 FL=1
MNFKTQAYMIALMIWPVRTFDDGHPEHVNIDTRVYSLEGWIDRQEWSDERKADFMALATESLVYHPLAALWGSTKTIPPVFVDLLTEVLRNNARRFA